MNRFSLIVTVYNEVHSIEMLLSSIDKMALQPNEVIVVDAGSEDGTIELLKQWSQKLDNGLFRYVVKPGLNRSQGRNYAIQLAKEDWIAVTDAGCIIDKEWLTEINKSINSEVCVVAGFYNAVVENIMQHVFGWYLAIQPDDLDITNFLPSSRSIAFRKSAWQNVGGYPERLDTCEDLVFARELKNSFGLVVATKALVYWTLPRTLGEFFATVSGYAMGDVQARYWQHVQKIRLVYLRYALFIVMPMLLPVYLVLWPWWKFRKRWMMQIGGKAGIQGYSVVRVLLSLPVVQFVSDVGVMWGGVRGWWSDKICQVVVI